MSPLERSNQKRVQDLENLSDTLPDRLANNLESSLTSALNSVATGAETNLGTIFGNIALDFGRALQQEINSAIAKDLVANITGGGGFQKFFGNIGNIVGGGGSTGGSTGGSGGGFFSGIKNRLGFNEGGLVSGGSGVRDDVPAKLTGGEYVMKKAAVQKYGPKFFDQINSGTISTMQQGGFFVPGTRGQGSIVGKEDLLGFATQEFTSGATDIMGSTGSGAFINLEDQSTRLTGFGRFRDSPARRALKAAQKQALDLYNARMAEEARVREANKQRSRQFKSAVIGSFMQAGLQLAVPAIGKGLSTLFQGPVQGPADNPFKGYEDIVGKGAYTPEAAGQRLLDTANRLFPEPTPSPFIPKRGPGNFGSSIMTEGERSLINNNPFLPPELRANGGGTYGNTNALLTDGEYIISSRAANSMGRQLLDDINNMRMPPIMMANGGAVGNVASSSSEGSSGGDIGGVNIEINMNDNGSAEVNASTGGGTKQSEAKEFAKKVKEVVVGVIAEEKRVSGSLFTRRK